MVYPRTRCARYERGGGLIRKAVLAANAGLVFDNSRLNEAPTRCLAFTGGQLTFALARLPEWVRSIYAADLEPST